MNDYILQLTEMIDEINENDIYTTLARSNLIKARRCLQKYQGVCDEKEY